MSEQPERASEDLAPFVRALEFNGEIGQSFDWVDEWLERKGLKRSDFFDAVLDITDICLERYEEDGADLRGAVGAAVVQALVVGFGAAEGRGLLLP